MCGTDEYGTATETKALEEGLSPLEVDIATMTMSCENPLILRYVLSIMQSMMKFISGSIYDSMCLEGHVHLNRQSKLQLCIILTSANDYFCSRIAQEIFWQLHANGFICEDKVKQLHCQSCDRYHNLITCTVPTMLCWMIKHTIHKYFQL